MRPGAGQGGKSSPLSAFRICDFSGQLAGAGSTRFLAAFGAEVIRIEDPVRQGRWDILRGLPPFRDERRGIEFGAGFQNHNVNKLGITLNLRTERGKELLRELVRVSDVVTENFAAGVLERLGFGYDALAAIRPDIIYVSNSGFGHTGPYRNYKTWGPIVQAVSGLTFTSGLPDQPPAGWGYSYMDHTGAYIMAIAILAALRHRQRTGEGQWVDMSCTEAGTTLHGPAILDWSVNGRAARRPGMPDSNHNRSPLMVPHNIYPAAGEDCWIAIACRDDRDWDALVSVIPLKFAADPDLKSVAGRAEREHELDSAIAEWTRTHERFEAAARLQAVGVPAAAVTRPSERIDDDPNVAEWGLWPEVDHPAMGRVRVDGLPVHLSETDWNIDAAAPLLGQHNDVVFGEILGLDQSSIDQLREEGVI
ncbi:MAG: CoA transferase [Acidimicrobiaceae bacterium]|nr:CoA transferase [Acidimicrobiaceae bacterium]